MKYKIGDEITISARVVEVDSEYGGYRVKFKDESDGLLTEEFIAENASKTYEQGLADAWELAKKIALAPNDGGVSNVGLYEIFGTASVEGILNGLTPEEALAKIEAYEREKEIKVGDVVELPSGYEIVVTTKNEHMVWGIDKRGDTFSGISKENVEKTGKHIDIEGLLRQIGE